jgi:hypothetical protein
MFQVKPWLEGGTIMPDTKYKKVNSPFQKLQDDSYVVLSPRGKMVLLNNTLYFLWNGCDGLNTYHSLAVGLYNACEDKATLSIKMIEDDVAEGMDMLYKNDLIYEV